MRRVVYPLNVFRWATLLISVFICALGAIRTRIFDQPIWDPAGRRRFIVYTIAFLIAAGLLFFSRRTLVVPCFIAAVALYAAAQTGQIDLAA